MSNIRQYLFFFNFFSIIYVSGHHRILSFSPCIDEDDDGDDDDDGGDTYNTAYGRQ